MTLASEYIEKCRAICDRISQQEKSIQQAAQWFAQTILKDRMVHVFGSGHSRIMVEEMWPRYGSFTGFNPMVELSLTFHNGVVGSNGQRQAMFLENVPGFASRIIRNYNITDADTALIISSSGCNVVPIEMAEIFQSKGVKVVSILTKAHSESNSSKRADGKKLSDFSDLILDTGAPNGDAMIKVQGLDTPVSPGSTVGGVMIVNAIKAEVARILTENGRPPKVLSSASVVGQSRSVELFESAYDEHARRLAILYSGLSH